jgi:hypothetical protein
MSFIKKIFPPKWPLWLGILVIVLAAAGCSGSSSDAAAAAIENYLDALVSKDAPRLVNASCAAWEVDANLELDSLAAVTVNLRDMDCQVSGQDGEVTLVSCTGALVANYEGEDQELLLSDRVYQVIQEGGEWRMCGYQ